MVCFFKSFSYFLCLGKFVFLQNELHGSICSFCWTDFGSFIEIDDTTTNFSSICPPHKDTPTHTQAHTIADVVVHVDFESD